MYFSMTKTQGPRLAMHKASALPQSKPRPLMQVRIVVTSLPLLNESHRYPWLPGQAKVKSHVLALTEVPRLLQVNQWTQQSTFKHRFCYISPHRSVFRHFRPSQGSTGKLETIMVGTDNALLSSIGDLKNRQWSFHCPNQSAVQFLAPPLLQVPNKRANRIRCNSREGNPSHISFIFRHSKP